MLQHKVCSLCAGSSLTTKLAKFVQLSIVNRDVRLCRTDAKMRKNEFGIEMIDEQVRRRLFNEDVEPRIDEKSYKSALRSIVACTKTKEFDHVLQSKKNRNEAVDSKKMIEIEHVESPSQTPSLEMPEMRGSNLIEHFETIAEEMSADYRRIMEKFANLECLPEMPSVWSQTAGWSKYNADGSVELVEYPNDDMLIFDVEVCVRDGSFPTLATAVSKNAWYSWCSRRLVDVQSKTDESELSIHDLIPLESSLFDTYEDFDKRKRLVVGHNVCFDRSFVKEQYYIQGTKLRFFDTMSAHISVAGLAGDQRVTFMYHQTGKTNKQYEKAARFKRPDNEVLVFIFFLTWFLFGALVTRLNFYDEDEIMPRWVNETSMNSLLDVHNLYKKDSKLLLDKEQRNVFVTGSLDDVRQNFQNLMSYCATDVAATFEVYCPLIKEYFQRFTSSVTLFGTLEMSSAFLPVNDKWNYYLNSADETYETEQKRIKKLLNQQCNLACRMLEQKKYASDLWMFSEDWTTGDSRRFVLSSKIKKPPSGLLKESSQGIRSKSKKKELSMEEDVVVDSEAEAKRLWNNCKEFKRPKVPFMSGFPEWYRSNCSSINAGKEFKFENWEQAADGRLSLLEGFESGATEISPSKRVASKVLRLTWRGFPLYYSVSRGWGYLKLDFDEFDAENSALKMRENDVLVEFPLKELAEFLRDNGHIYEEDEIPCKLARFRNSAIKFYQLPHKDGHGNNPDFEPENNVGNPLAKPFIPFMDRKILSSENPEHVGILSELSKKCSYWKNNLDRIKNQMVLWMDRSQLPVDLQCCKEKVGIILPRLVVAGTVTRRAVERTWMTASNAKKDRIGSELKGILQTPPGYCFVGADVDSQELWIASLFGDSSKYKVHGSTPFSYMILKGNKNDKTDQHTVVAEELKITRDHAKVLNYGRLYGAGLNFAALLLQQFLPSGNKQDIQAKAKDLYVMTKGRRSRLAGTDRNMWKGGSESELFNCLESIARSDSPKTPVLKCRISKSLEPRAIGDQFLPSRVNWIIQSSAVDFLHSMLTCMRWLCDEHEISARFSLSVHDEVRYLVKDKDKYRAALAMQLTNLYTRALFVYSVNMRDLPQSVAYFSKVDIDKAFRKEVDDDNVTPSNPLGLRSCYNIPKGEALTMEEIIEKTGGKLSGVEKKLRIEEKSLRSVLAKKRDVSREIGKVQKQYVQSSV